MARSPIIDFIDGYEESGNAGGARSHTGKRFFVRSFSGAVTQKVKRFTSLGLVKLVNAFAELIAYTSTKSYGASFLSFGLATLLLHFLRDYFGVYDAHYTASLIIGAIFAILAVPLLLTDKPLSLLFQDNEITDYILFEFFCIKRMHRSSVGRSVPVWVSILVGVLLAGLGYFIPTWWIATGICAFAYTCVAIVSPEFSFFATFMVLPYLSYIPSPYSEIGFSFIVLITAISFVRKVLYGKRAVHIEQYDVLLGLMMLSIMLSGIFIKGVDSFTNALVMLVMSFGYILASNLLTNRRLTHCAMNAMVISSLPATIISLVELIISAIDGSITERLLSGISSGFAECDVAAVFFLTALIFAIGLAKQSHGSSRAFYVALSLLDLIALLLTGELFAMLALVIGGMAYFALKARGAYVFIIILLLLIPYSVFLLPIDTLEVIFERIPSISGAADLIDTWRASLRVLADNLWFGIGIGENSFTAEMESVGISGAQSAGNLFIELGLEAGIFALIFFMLILLVRLRHRVMYQPYLKSSQVSVVSPIISVCVFALLCFGAVDYIWSDFSEFYIFWCVFGMGSATMRVAKRDNDDELMYYEDTRRSTFSAINIEIRPRRGDRS